MKSGRRPDLSLSNAGAEGGPPSAIRLRALSLDAGVQSTALALMAAHGAVGPMTVTIDRDDGPRRRSSCATCLPTSRGARAEPRQQPRKLAAERHIRTGACSFFSGRASGHRRRGEAGSDHVDARCINHSALNCAWFDLPIVHPLRGRQSTRSPRLGPFLFPSYLMELAQRGLDLACLTGNRLRLARLVATAGRNFLPLPATPPFLAGQESPP